MRTARQPVLPPRITPPPEPPRPTSGSLARPAIKAEPETRATVALTQIMRLERLLRVATTRAEIGFTLVNEIHALTPCSLAVSWPDEGEGARIQAVSGLSSVDPQAPLVQRLNRLRRSLCRRPDGALALSSLSEDENDLIKDLPPHALWLRSRTDDAGQAGHQPQNAALHLLCLRDQPWTPTDREIISHVHAAACHAWDAVHRKHSLLTWPSLASLRRRRLLWGALVITLAILLFPFHQTVLAPAEIVPRNPAIVRAPMQGVVRDVLVAPNQTVEKGTPLAKLETRDIDARLDTARQDLVVSEAELRQAHQQAFTDDQSKARLAILQGRRDQDAADVRYYQSLHDQALVRAPRDGIAIYDDPSDWVGRSVSVGERIMMVANPLDAELQVALPVADAIHLHPGARTEFFLNVSPLSPLPGHLTVLGYRASPTPDGAMAYRLKARFDALSDVSSKVPTLDPDSPIRVGLQGSAKLYGDRTPLLLTLLRRPLATLRMRLGL